MTAVASPFSVSSLKKSPWAMEGQTLDAMYSDETPSQSASSVNGGNPYLRKNGSRSSGNLNGTNVTMNGNGPDNLHSPSLPSPGSSPVLSSPTDSIPQPRLQQQQPQPILQQTAMKRRSTAARSKVGNKQNSSPSTSSPSPLQQQQLQNGTQSSPDGQKPYFDQSSSMSRWQSLANSFNNMTHPPSQPLPTPGNSLAKTLDVVVPKGHPFLYLTSINGTFDRKTIAVPQAPETFRIGRQTNQKLAPTPVNGFFDSKVLSRQHAEIWADHEGAIWVRDVKSSNGTFINGNRLSQESRESDPVELRTNDLIEFGIDIAGEDQLTIAHHKVAAKVEFAGPLTNSVNLLDFALESDMILRNGRHEPNGNVNGNGNHMNGTGNGGAVNGRGSGGASGYQASGNRVNGQSFESDDSATRGALAFPSIGTETIIRKLHLEMRNAKLHHDRMNRANDFVRALLAKEDLQSLDEAKAAVKKPSLSFRTTELNARFPDPPAPPPKQPLPDKPPGPSKYSQNHGNSERMSAKALAQQNEKTLRQLHEELRVVQIELTNRDTQIETLEQELLREQEARLDAENLLQTKIHTRELDRVRGERESDVQEKDTTISTESTASDTDDEGTVILELDEEEPELGPSTSLKEITMKSRSSGQPSSPNVEATSSSVEDKASNDSSSTSSSTSSPSTDNLQTALESRITSLMVEMDQLRQQVEVWKNRCETAEKERASERSYLMDMVTELREKERIRQLTSKDKVDDDVDRVLMNGSDSSPAGKTTSMNGKRSGGHKKSRSISSTTSATSNGAIRGVSTSSSGADGGQNGSMGGDQKTSMVADTTAGTSSSETKTSITSHGTFSHSFSSSVPLHERDMVGPSLTSGDGKLGLLRRDQARETASLRVASLPYASMFGVVLLGVGLMAYINGWQPQNKVSDL